MSKTYTDAIKLLNRLQTPYALLESNRKDGHRSKAIEGMGRWLEKIGHSVDDLNRLGIIHVAGTEGKTSTCAFAASILNQHRIDSGYPRRVGLYTSPHLTLVLDRYQIDGKPPPEALFLKYFNEVWEKINPLNECGRPGYFAFLTLLAFHMFLAEDVTAAVFETGVGGRNDATNIISRPIVTAITRIGYDHVRTLRRPGQSGRAAIEDIAWHKAGIMKKGCPALSVPQLPRVLDTLRAEAKGVSLRFVDTTDEVRALPLKPDIQKENASLALAATDIFLGTRRDDVGEGLTKISEVTAHAILQTPLRGRFQTVIEEELKWYLDGAHNEDSLKGAAGSFAEVSKHSHPSLPRILIYYQDPQRELGLPVLFRSLEEEGVSMQHVIFCSSQLSQDGPEIPDLVNHNSDPATKCSLQDQVTYKAHWASLDAKAEISVKVSVMDALESARQIGVRNGAVILITGSLRLVGAALYVLEPKPG